ncbi:MAG: hypothetical protein AAF561_14290 [Planctomycetota bacterium]
MLDSTFLIYWTFIGFVMLAVFRRPSVAVAAFLCTYGLEQWAQSRSTWFFINSSLTNMATGGLLVWALMMRVVKGQGIVQGGVPPVAILIGALFGWVVLSVLWSPVPATSAANIKEQFPYLVAAIVLMPLIVRDFADARAGLLMTVFLGMVILLLLLTTTNWTGREITFAGVGGTVKDERGNPLAIASLGGWIALIALLFNFKGLSTPMTIIRYAVVVLGLLIAIRSNSRGQVFALVTAGLLFLPLSRQLKNAKQLVVVGAGVALVLGITFLLFQSQGLTESERWSTEQMVETYGDSRLGPAGMLLEAWWAEGPAAWIIGLGSSASFSGEIVGFYPHLVLLEVLGELGFIGFTLLVSLTAVTFYNAYRIAKVSEDPQLRGVAAALAALFMFEVILSFKQGSLLGTPMAFGFAMLIGRLWQTIKTDPVSSLASLERPMLAQAPAMLPGAFTPGAMTKKPTSSWLDNAETASPAGL